MVRYNPASSYTWIALEETAAAADSGSELFDFIAARKKNDADAAAMANALLFIKDKDIEARDKRIDSMDSGYPLLCRKLIKDAEKLNVKWGNRKKLAGLEKYFRIGDYPAIIRELSFIAADAEDISDKRRALLKFSIGHKNANLALLAYSELAKDAGIIENLFEMPFDIAKIILPKPFGKCVSEAANEFNIDEAVILSVMKSESLFKHDVRSTAGALGLMQVLPSTAKPVAASIKMTEYSLYDPCDSIRIGTKHLSGLKNIYGSDERMLFAAYNAGSRNLSKWRGISAVKGNAAFADKIPFDETRLYVLKTIRHSIQYRIFYP